MHSSTFLSTRQQPFHFLFDTAFPVGIINVTAVLRSDLHPQDDFLSVWSSEAVTTSLSAVVPRMLGNRYARLCNDHISLLSDNIVIS